MNLSVWNIIIIAALIFLLFGSQKFPAMMKNLADGIRVFKKEIDKSKTPKATESPPDSEKPVKKKPVKKVVKKKK